MEFKKKIRRDTLTHTIRFSGETYDKICKIAEENKISFNNVVNQIVDNFFENEGED